MASMLKPETAKILMIELNRIVSRTAKTIVQEIEAGNYGDNPGYPGATMTTEEKAAIRTLDKSSEKTKLSALHKVLQDAAASSLFDFLSLIDEVSDPESAEHTWKGISLKDRENDDSENYEMLHDEFFERYWEAQNQ